VNSQLALLQVPPEYCRYAGGPCDQDFSNLPASNGVFLYGSDPPGIAATLEAAVELLRGKQPTVAWSTWRDFSVSGQLIFCEICKRIRGATTVYADVTTLNFNLLFEIGFAIGLGVPVVPVRDTTYERDKRAFEAIGVLDTVGYIDFLNADELANRIVTASQPAPLPIPAKKTYLDAPLYVLKGQVDTEGAVRLMSTIKKSALRFRVYDPRETPRLSLQAARKQISGSFGVIANLLSPHRGELALAHNGLCALLCGVAMAEGKVVAMLQEDTVRQPIDYRDVVQTYDTPDQVPLLLEEPLRHVLGRIQDAGITSILPPPVGILGKLDLGDSAAENEIRGLKEYFVQTGQFRQAVQGHARLVVGRKGTGKTAIYYEARDYVRHGRSTLILDMKPDGHQLTKLREVVLAELSEGQREHTVTAFWTYLLLAELGHKLQSEAEYGYAQRDPVRFQRYQALQDAFLSLNLASGEDLSQRLLRLVDRLAGRFGDLKDISARSDITELVYGGDIPALQRAVSAYLAAEKDEVWMLVDDLDKSWVTRGTTHEDMLILRGLLEATRKLQRQLQDEQVDFHCLVFLRTDIFDHLTRDTPDRGKDQPIRLEWDDVDAFREIVRRRIESSTDMQGSFDEMWPRLFAAHIGVQESFTYLVERTLMRPRDLLNFIQRCVEVALNRGHARVEETDVRQAEASYSEDMLYGLVLEVEDTHADLADALYAFHGAGPFLSEEQVREVLGRSGVQSDALEESIELLLWFGFLGIQDDETHEERYSHDVRFNLRQLTHPIQIGKARYALHPAFRAALAALGS
jgi:hypothetical protein